MSARLLVARPVSRRAAMLHISGAGGWLAALLLTLSPMMSAQVVDLQWKKGGWLFENSAASS